MFDAILYTRGLSILGTKEAAEWMGMGVLRTRLAWGRARTFNNASFSTPGPFSIPVSDTWCPCCFWACSSTFIKLFGKEDGQSNQRASVGVRGHGCALCKRGGVSNSPGLCAAFYS